jgi:hypothetical protein
VPEREHVRRDFHIIGAIGAGVVTCLVGATAAVGPADAATSAESEYQAALKAATAQNVHFVSRTIEQGERVDEVGDTGRSSGSLLVDVQSGAPTQRLSIILVGSKGYVEGNDPAMEKILGLTTAQATEYANRWLSFPTSDASLNVLVSGLLTSHIASEIQMSGPYTFGKTKVIAGHDTQAIMGEAPTSSGTKVPIVLYVESSGTPRPVEEITEPSAKGSSISGSVIFSQWGEKTDPVAPTKSVALIPLLNAS